MINFAFAIAGAATRTSWFESMLGGDFVAYCEEREKYGIILGLNPVGKRMKFVVKLSVRDFGLMKERCSMAEVQQKLNFSREWGKLVKARLKTQLQRWRNGR